MGNIRKIRVGVLHGINMEYEIKGKDNSLIQLRFLQAYVSSSGTHILLLGGSLFQYICETEIQKGKTSVIPV